MFDHQEARLWADHHAAFSSWASGAVRAIGEVFVVLTERHYDAPWRRRAEPHGSAADSAPRHDGMRPSRG